MMTSWDQRIWDRDKFSGTKTRARKKRTRWFRFRLPGTRVTVGLEYVPCPVYYSIESSAGLLMGRIVGAQAMASPCTSAHDSLMSFKLSYGLGTTFLDLIRWHTWGVGTLRFIRSPLPLLPPPPPPTHTHTHTGVWARHCPNNQVQD